MLISDVSHRKILVWGKKVDLTTDSMAAHLITWPRDETC